MNEVSVKMSNGKKFTLKPVKLKYLKNRDFLLYQLLKETDLVQFFGYNDAPDLFGRFMSAVLDRPYEEVQEKQEDGNYKSHYEFDPEIADMFDELVIKDVELLIEKALEVNGIDPNEKKTETATD